MDTVALCVRAVARITLSKLGIVSCWTVLLCTFGKVPHPFMYGNSLNRSKFNGLSDLEKIVADMVL